MNNNLRKFNQHNNASYDRLTIGVMPWQDVSATNKPKEEANIDRLWETVARNIAYEQAIKEEQRQALNQETVRMIKELEEYDKARKIGRNPSNRTEIQGSYEVPSQPNEIADNDEPRTQVNDDNLYEANALPYKQGSVRLGIWRGGNPSQYVTFASDSPQPKGIGDVLTGEGSYMIDVFQNHGNHQYRADRTVAPGVGIDDAEGYGYYAWEEAKKHRADIERMVNGAERHAREIMGDFLFDLAINLLNIFIAKEVKKPIDILILLYGVYQCVAEAYKEEIRLYMQEYNCSYDEAKEMVRPGTRFVRNFWSMMMGDWLNEVLDRLGIPMLYRNAIIHTVNELLQNKTNQL